MLISIAVWKCYDFRVAAASTWLVFTLPGTVGLCVELLCKSGSFVYHVVVHLTLTESVFAGLDRLNRAGNTTLTLSTFWTVPILMAWNTSVYDIE